MSTDAFQAPSPDYLAELLPQYGIEAFIAQGGMGAVYKARQISLDRDVAIKVLPKELGADAEFRESFITEAKAMARLNHPNLLGVFDYGNVDDMPYIVMEYVEGGSLHQAAWNKAIEPFSAVSIVKAICDGLAHAHENGIIHRDIKPSNILLTTKVEPKVADFGLAHSTDAEESGMMMGTPGYTAPEVFRDSNQAGVLADIYSVGVILHQLLTGIDPAGSAGPPTHPTGNLRLDALWRKATHINPSLRYGTMAAMAADLGKWLATSKRGAVSTGAPAYSPPKHPTTTIKSGGGGLVMKLVIIAVLGTAVYFTYQMLQQQKAENIKAVTEANSAARKVIPPKPPEIKITPIVPPAITDNNATGADTHDDADVPEVKEDEVEKIVKPAWVYSPGDPELLERAVGLIAETRKKRDAAFADNAREMIFQIGAAARSVKRDEAESVLVLREDIVENRIPLTDEVIGLPDALSRDFERARAKEESIIESYRGDLTRIRDSYVSRLLAKAEEETDADGETKRNLLEQAKRAKDLDKWIKKLAPEPKWSPRSSSAIIGGVDFVGKWIHHGRNGVSRTWIARRNGTVEVDGEDWGVEWEILKNGTLLVKREGGDFETYIRNGDDWDCEDGSGRSLTRED